MNIGITLTKYSYTPEAYAYERYLTKLGWNVQLDYEYELDKNNDINIYFMGIRPFWKGYQGKALEIHEYQSLSTPPYAKIKDNIKKLINFKPSGRIFLNHTVHHNLNFNDKIPFIYRDMGVDEAFFQFPKANPEYDIIYSGSINRTGVPDIILLLAKKYKIIVVGSLDNLDAALVDKLRCANITLVGKVDRFQLPGLYANARFGLNYTPNVYPFNVQTSTKTLEYLASGLPVISNRYFWMERFSEKVNQKVLWLDVFLKSNIDLMASSLNIVSMRDYAWENILKTSKLEDFLYYEVSNR